MDGVVSEQAVARPAPPLRRHVHRYVGYRMAGFPAGVHRGLPSRHPTWLVSIDDPIEVVAQTDPRQAPATYRAVISGLQARPALIAHPGRTAGIAIELTPLGLRTLLGVPARALWDTSCELADVVGPAGDELWERLQLAGSWEARFAACDEVLGRLSVDQAVTPELAEAWRLLVGSGGTATVGEVAARVGWTRQHLGHRFRAELGVGPKLAARVIRFERARLGLRDGPAAGSIARVAAECGYYDQAHLHRDFVELAGCSPSRWLAEEGLPSVQDDGPGGGGGS